MYVVLLFLLVILAGVANAFMDTWSFHYPGSKLFQWGQKWPRFRRFSGPDSWKNKYRFTGLWGYVMKTALSPLTDLWHLSQFLMLTAFQILIAWHAPGLNEIVGGRVGDFYFNIPFWANVLIWVGAQKFLFGLAFEAVFEWLGNKPKRSEVNILSLNKKKYSCERCETPITAEEYVKADGLCESCWARQFIR